VRPNELSSNLLRPFLMMGSVVLVVAALYWAQRILIPIALSVLLCFILAPFVNALHRRGLNRSLSVIVVVALALMLVMSIGAVITLQLGRLVEELPQHRHNIAAKITGVREATQHGTFVQKVQEITRDITAAWTRDEQAEKDLRDQPIPVEVRNDNSGVARVLSALGPAAEVIAGTALVLVLVIFMLIHRENLRNRLVRLIGHGRLIPTTHAIDEASRRISRFLLSQLLINAGFGLVLALGLLIIGVPYAFLWGACALVLRFIPYVGTWALAALLICFSFFLTPGWTEPLMVLGLFAGLELLTFHVVEPLVFGHNTGISTVALLVSAAFWAWLWGPIGLVLSTPITACLVVLGRYSPPLEFLEILLGDGLQLEPRVVYYQRLLARDEDEAWDVINSYRKEHSDEAMFDEVLIPALTLANRDLARGELSEDDHRFVVQATESLLDETLPPSSDLEEAQGVWVMGCPAHGSVDELALRMFQRMLGSAGVHLEVATTDMLTAEMVEKAGQERPTVVCIAALPPGGLAQTRYLCKRFRKHYPNIKIVIGAWGSHEGRAPLAERLSLTTAQVATTLADSRSQLIPLVQVHGLERAHA
jgi:predicted PurR-regulated permease PerM